MTKEVHIRSSSGERVDSILAELRAWKKDFIVNFQKHNEISRQDFLYQSILSQKILPSDSALFTITGWSIAPEFALWLHAHVKRKEITRIVELGSGLSTIVLAAALRENGLGRLLSVEHDPHYHAQTKGLLVENGLEEWVDLVLSPLKNRRVDRQSFLWYGLTTREIEKLLGDEKVDLLLVDGPPGGTHPLARFPAYPLFKRFMAPNGLVILDNCAREPEQNILEKWAEMEHGKYKYKILPNMRHAPALFYSSEHAFGPGAKSSEPIAPVVAAGSSKGANAPVSTHRASTVANYVADLVQRKILRAEHAEIIALRHELHLERELHERHLEKLHQDGQLAALNQKITDMVFRTQQLEEIEAQLRADVALKDETLETLQTRLMSIDRAKEEQGNELLAAWAELDELRAELARQRSESATLSEQCETHKRRNAELERTARDNTNMAWRIGRMLDLADSTVSSVESAVGELQRSTLTAQQELHALQVESAGLKQQLARLQERSDALSSERKELLQRIAHVGGNTATLEEKLATTSSKLAKSELMLADREARIAAKLLEEAEAEAMSRDVFATVSGLQREDIRLRAELAHAQQKVERIKGYLSYRLGAAIVQNSANPLHWIKLPFKMARAYSDYKAARQGRTLAAQMAPLDLDSIEVSRVQPTYVGLGNRWKVLVIAAGRSMGFARRLMLRLLTPKANASFTAEIQITSSTGQIWEFKNSSSVVFSLQTNEVRAVELAGGSNPIYFDIPNLEDVTFELRIRKLRGSPCIVKAEFTWAREADIQQPQPVASLVHAPAAAFVGSTNSLPEKAPAEVSGSAPKSLTADQGNTAEEGFPKPMPNAIMWQAQQLALERGADIGIRFAERFARAEVKPAANLLAANKEIGDDLQWLSRLNAYADQFPVSQVELRAGSESRFERIYSISNRKHVGGPLVTVIMPSFNAEKTIRHAVKSILGQTWQELELIIVDDASVDGTWEIIKDLRQQDRRITAVRNAENVGPYVSKNLALSIAKGVYITGHDADDWAYPDRIAIQTMALLESDGSLKANMAKMLRLTEEGRFVYFTKENKISDDGVLRDAAISTMFEAEYFRKHLGHWDCVRFGADSELISRAEKVMGSQFRKLRQLVMLCLDTEGSLTNDPVHGLSKTSGMSPTRKYYKDQWVAWHKMAETADCYLPFPHTGRRFRVPDAAFVPETSITANIAAHAEFLRSLSAA